mgnify:FL=1
MRRILFSIKDLKCSYDSGKIVLDIDRLDIYDGQITFIVGKSGSGKSTLLETLGFMNDTFSSRTPEQVVFHDAGSNDKTDLASLWLKPLDMHSAFRNKNYSFIFQENNLLEHFNSSENILIPILLSGKDKSEGMKEIQQAFERIHLPPDIFNRNIRLLSGGQRQRISFLRALLANKPVLFGDEPTGNLDPITAKTLMTMVREDISRSGSSAIIVSHDLNLAHLFADRIVTLKVDENRQCGIIGGIFERKDNGWLDQLSHKNVEHAEITS